MSLMIGLRVYRAGACDVTSAALNRNVWHLYGNTQSIGPVRQLAAPTSAPTETQRRLRTKGIKLYPIRVKIEGKTVVEFNKYERF